MKSYKKLYLQTQLNYPKTNSIENKLNPKVFKEYINNLSQINQKTIRKRLTKQFQREIEKLFPEEKEKNLKITQLKSKRAVLQRLKIYQIIKHEFYLQS